MPASFPEDPLHGGIRRGAGGNECEANRDAGASADDKSRGHDVITDAGFIVGLRKWFGVRLIRVHSDAG
jgi:hypothetical protein